MDPPRRSSLSFRSLLLPFLLLLLIHGARSFYLPGVAPEDFDKGHPLMVKVNKLTSIKTQLPYSFYSLPFCRPKKILDSAENLGEVLRGDRIENSPYEFKMREAKMCKTLCHLIPDAKQTKDLKEKIADEYRVNMILDNLPVVVPLRRSDQDSTPVYQLGFHVGLKGHYSGSKEEKYFIHNHLAFTVKYHRDAETDLARIVGFEVKPFSVKHEYEGTWSENTRLTTCDPHSKHTVVNSNSPQEVEEKKEIIFTYDVEFQESDVKWASRWDTYLLMSDDQIHWFSIVNSLMIVLFLSGMVAMIMLRTLFRDISKYNELETQEEAQEETGWKLVHGDVFRPPSNSDMLCIYVGTGVQFLGMILVTMIFAILGFLSPSNRGGLMTAMLLLWVFMGLFAGYASSRLYKMFKGTEWKKIALRTAIVFPAIVFAIFFVLNALIWGQKSSGAVPFGTMFALVFLWFGISVPLVFVGAYIGFKKPADLPSPTMSHPLSFSASNPVLSPFRRPSAAAAAAASPLLRRSLFGAHLSPRPPPPLPRGALCVARLGFSPDPESAEVFARELFGRAEGLLYTIADAAVSSSSPDAVAASATDAKQSGDWLSGITNSMESVLKVLKDGLSILHVPYAYGFAIILLTVLVKAATFPLTKKQVESAMAMRSLQPQIKAIQEQYAGDQERIQLETARLYKLAGINPLAGCLPTLATIPVWIGLYRALSNVADEGLLTEGFFWIPSLAGPTTIAARQNGSGISWLFPFVDGHPPLGWSDTLAYLVLPLLLVFTQYMSVQIMQSSQRNDPSMKGSQAITKFLPLMIGYFSLSVPSGLSLYWLTNNILSTAQQVWLQKLGGAKNPLNQFGNNTIKLDEMQNQKIESEFMENSATTQLSSTKKVAEKENLTVEGPRPGERFKQIKEQEERRRREREQQKKDATAAVKEIQVADERHEKETSVPEVNNETRAPLVNKSTEEAQYKNSTYHSSNGGVVVNGNLLSPELQEDEKASPARSDKGAVVADNDVERSDN